MDTTDSFDLGCDVLDDVCNYDGSFAIQTFEHAATAYQTHSRHDLLRHIIAGDPWHVDAHLHGAH